MKKSLCYILFGSAFLFSLFAQSVQWQKLIPFESDDDGPVGIDITDTGEILVAYYTNGPNEGVWTDDSLTHSPVTKVARLDATGNLIDTEDHGHLFTHSVTGIGITENGYTLSGNIFSPFFDGTYWYDPISALLINFQETGRDTIEYLTHNDDEYNCTKIKTSLIQSPMAFVTRYPSAWTGTGGASENFVIDLNNNITGNYNHVLIPDTISFSKYSFFINDIAVSTDNKTILSGIFSNAIFQLLSYLICIDSGNNVLWEHFYDIGWSDSQYFSSVSYSPDGGCISGEYSSHNNYIRKYDSLGILQYSIGPYPAPSNGDMIEWVYSIGNNEYLYKNKRNDTVFKIVDTGTGLIEDWSFVPEGIKAVRAVENGFVAAGVKDGNIWVKCFDPTAGINYYSGIPTVTTLYQNYPNPFNPVTQIKFDLAKTGNVKLSVYNINGQKVAELVNGVMNVGHYAVDFDGTRLNSGIFYYTLEADGNKMTKRMLMVK